MTATYNPQQQLQNELVMLRARKQQIESVLGTNAPSPQPPPPMVHEPQMIPDMSTHKRQRSQYEPENMIDPSLFEDYELMDIDNMVCPQMKHVELECNGLLENNSLMKRDYVYGIFYHHLLRYKEPSPTVNLEGRKADRFTMMIENSQYQFENFYKYKSSSSVSELVKTMESKLPTKKIIWLMVQRFFTSIAYPFCPTLDEKKFTERLSKIIGGLDNTDTELMLDIDVSRNDDLVCLLKLMFIVRIVQISLLATMEPDKLSNYLLKNSQPSQELEFLIDVFLLLLMKFNIANQEKVELQLMALFLSTISFDGVRPLDYSPSNIMSMAIQLRLNSQGEIGSNEDLKQMWYSIYVSYYMINIQYGLPFFLSEDFFNIELTESGDHVGKKFLRSINANYTKQIEVFKVVRVLMNTLHKTQNGLGMTTVSKLLKDYDNVVVKQFGLFDTFKNDIGATYSDKIGKVMNILLHKLTKANVLCLIMLHLEAHVNAPGDRFEKYIIEYQDVCNDSVVMCFDILRNYNSYFNSGYEFLVFGGILKVLEKLLKELTSFVLRVELWNKPHVALLRFFLNIIEELDRYHILKNYFPLWRLQNRTKILLHMLKGHHVGEIDIFRLKFEFQGETIDFSGYPTQFSNLDESTWHTIDEGFDTMNRCFNTKYSTLTTKGELFDAMDFPMPEFNIKYFH